jgi:hypothetical protein
VKRLCSAIDDCKQSTRDEIATTDGEIRRLTTRNCTTDLLAGCGMPGSLLSAKIGCYVAVYLTADARRIGVLTGKIASVFLGQIAGYYPSDALYREIGQQDRHTDHQTESDGFGVGDVVVMITEID